MKDTMARAVGACGLAAALALSLAGCAGGQTAGESGAPDAPAADAPVANVESVDVADLDLSFSKRDTDASYDAETATKVTLADGGITVDGEGATAEGSTVTLSAAGTYLLSGSLADGRVIVSAGDEDKLQVVFDGVSVHSETGPAFLVENADKCFITLADGSENALTDGASHETAEDENDHDAALFSHDDFTINGAGTLSVVGTYKHAINSNDDLVIAGGTLEVTSTEDALRGKDCIKATTADITVNAGDDALHSDGYLYIEDGTVDVQACYEGYEAEQIIINGGTHTITATDDALNAALSDPDTTDATSSVISTGARSAEWRDPVTTEDDASAPTGQQGDPSTPALQASARDDGGVALGAPDQDDGGMAQSSSSCLIQINGGTLTLTAGNDAVDSNGNVEINGGTVLASGPDAGMDGSLDYDLSATINGGTVLMVGSVGSTQGLSEGDQSVAYGSVQGSAGQAVSLVDSAGVVLVTFTAGADFTSVLASSPEIGAGDTFSIQVEGHATELTMGEGLDMVQNDGMGMMGQMDQPRQFEQQDSSDGQQEPPDGFGQGEAPDMSGQMGPGGQGGKGGPMGKEQAVA